VPTARDGHRAPTRTSPRRRRASRHSTRCSSTSSGCCRHLRPGRRLLVLGMDFRSMPFRGDGPEPHLHLLAPVVRHGPAYRFHRRALQLLQWRCPPTSWWLENPSHMHAIVDLDRVYRRSFRLDPPRHHQGGPVRRRGHLRALGPAHREPGPRPPGSPQRRRVGHRTAPPDRVPRRPQRASVLRHQLRGRADRSHRDGLAALRRGWERTRARTPSGGWPRGGTTAPRSGTEAAPCAPRASPSTSTSCESGSSSPPTGPTWLPKVPRLGLAPKPRDALHRPSLNTSSAAVPVPQGRCWPDIGRY